MTRWAEGVVARLVRAAVALLVLALLVGQALPGSPPVTMARQDVGPAGATPTVESPPLGAPPLVGPPPDAPPAELFPPALSTPAPPPLGSRVGPPAVVTGTVVVPGADGRPILQCPDPVEPVAPLPLLSTPTAIPLYQPIPRPTGELVVVANTNGQGAPLRVAPPARSPASCGPCRSTIRPTLTTTRVTRTTTSCWRSSART